ncbi:MAG: bifunctional phosphoribosylaminoimidazolecarboxamide formyltransferase/IMP cyclohydrolase [candidate division Zixibacteria bacterium]|nr:bifunctional phosphoribosylaminoimidazolecarboxamide formyltransferase/IMP cyclohydrolase [candidate division Zixibacteria bacterium]MDH3938674.1 bifunctional phosphoribosylaminoimidazolecarboxamide formyltransferase/IMP cyclohydrolase [candidate division Zixibacteria bacterium]MDH4033239.1 bifunctional phosphoribosylaminoimidazolecarboxamide formyltransferase/IMP cyclohydrolase [candidate division Zixibacteria bacterium]
MSDKVKIKRAVISVSDKSGVEDLALKLEAMGVEILSTGGTMKRLKEAGVQVISVSTFTGAPEIMGGRVKTLHPKIYAGILCRRDNPGDMEQLSEQDYRPIDLVVVNLYPFQQTVARQDADDAEIIENIDIGGPSMIRASSKNYEAITVVVDPSDYGKLIEQMEANDSATDLEFRKSCAAKAFAQTAAYDSAIATYYKSGRGAEADKFPAQLTPSYSFTSQLRYGENPHQQAAVYAANDNVGPTLLEAEVLSGKELSYNNYGDLDAALDLVLDFSEPFACVLKHANPCGAAVGASIAEAYQAAYDSDPLSAFGSIIGLNREVDLECAKVLHETPFVECVLAPSYSDDALKLLKKKKNRRLLALPTIAQGMPEDHSVYKYIRGGLLVQAGDVLESAAADLRVVTKRAPTDEEIKSLLFAWRVVKHTKSNAIVLAKGNATVGVGMGQTSRVDSGFMAVKRAGDRAKGAVMASDAFFPMPDGVEVATDVGVTAIIQPGGSKGDEQAIKAADKAGAAMVFTGVRHFKH